MHFGRVELIYFWRKPAKNLFNDIAPRVQERPLLCIYHRPKNLTIEIHSPRQQSIRNFINKGYFFYCITSIQSMKGITQFLVSQMHNFVCLASINKDWSLEIFSNYFRKINFFIVKLRMEIMLTDTMKIDICRQSMDS